MAFEIFNFRSEFQGEFMASMSSMIKGLSAAVLLLVTPSGASVQSCAAGLRRGPPDPRICSVTGRNMPTLAYRVETDAGSIVFSSDQNGSDPKFVEFAKGADILVMHLMTPVGMKNPLHAEPAVVGRMAQEVRPGRLILSHIGLAGPELDAAIYFTGRYHPRRALPSSSRN